MFQGNTVGAGNSQCRFENPVEVCDMDAVFYHFTCASEGWSRTQRAMFLRRLDGLVVIDDESLIDLVYCHP